MARPTIRRQAWVYSCALLVIQLAKESSGWLNGPTCLEVETGRHSRRRGLARVRARRAVRHVNLHANTSKGEGAGGDSVAGGGGNKADAAAASAPSHQRTTTGKQERVQAAEDGDAPIFYIRGLKEGGGVGVWGSDDDGGKQKGGDGDTPRARQGGGNAAMMARALRNAEREIEGGGNYEEGEEGGEIEQAADAMPVWDKVQAALGLGFWSYAGLGLAVFIIILNNVLGVGWAAKIINPEFEPDSVLDVQQQGRQIQYMPLDDASNLLEE